jgi:hypothetical protein
MPAKNPKGQETYWLDGQPCTVLHNTKIRIKELDKYWSEGAPVAALLPQENNLSYLLLIDF